MQEFYILTHEKLSDDTVLCAGTIIHHISLMVSMKGKTNVKDKSDRFFFVVEMTY